MTIFTNRRDAGRRLATALEPLVAEERVHVLGLPRGGVAVAREVASALGAELDVAVVCKLGVPERPELAMGAVSAGGARSVNASIVRAFRVSPATFQQVAHDEALEASRRERLYRGARSPSPVRDKTVVLVDDGMSTGATMLAALRAVRPLGPARIIVAVPTGSTEACELMRGEADAVVCLETPQPFVAIGCWYQSFEQADDREVRRLLASARPSGSEQEPREQA